MREIADKYDTVAELYSERDYADPERYYARRASLVVEQEPRLQAGETVLDLACGDGRFGVHLIRLGIDYRGVDSSPRMVATARQTLGERVVRGTFDHVPGSPVTATTIFRSLYLVPDRRAFLARVRRYTERKLVFDFNPRAYPAGELIDDVYAAGWQNVTLRPFLMPQRARLPRAVQAALLAFEPLPGSRLLTNIRFPLLVTASG